jgi:phage/plasmid-like protein (TIGR03299 family)
MAHEVETMAYAVETPWHGLGARVDRSVTVDGMLEAAGLNWRLDRVPLIARMESGEEIEIENKFAHIRNTDRKVMAVSSGGWNPLQPAATLEFMRDYVEAGAATLETAGSLRDGKVVWGLARLNSTFEVRPGDKVNGYVLITSPNEVGTAITVRTTTVRVVCANTMAMANREGNGETHYRQTHMGAFDIAAAKEAIGDAHEQLAQAERNARTLDKLRISASDAVTKVLLPVFFPDVEGEELAELSKLENMPLKLLEIMHSMETGPGNAELEGTGWGVMNGVTHWADHVAGRTQAARLNRAWLGDTCRQKLAVEKALLELAS